MSIKNIKNACCVFDFTVSEDKADEHQIIKWCRKYGKKYSFQLEKGEETGYLHYQCRVSLQAKTRTPHKLPRDFPVAEEAWSVTSEENRSNFFYVTKEETRVKGPWTDEDPYYKIPRQLVGLDTKYYPWQKAIAEDCANEWTPNIINVVYDKGGLAGKSTIANYLNVMGIAKRIPSTLSTADKLMGFVFSFKEYRAYTIDVPRALQYKHQDNIDLWLAIEDLKGGYVYDWRNKGRDRIQDCPQLWVFTNYMPPLKYITKERWKIWKINPARILSAVDLRSTCNSINIQNPGTSGTNDNLFENSPESTWNNHGADPEQTGTATSQDPMDLATYGF